jgi:hypothetical protein
MNVELPCTESRRAGLVFGAILIPLLPKPRCLVPAFDGAFLSREWKEALWARFYTGAPLRQRRYNVVKRA